ncbi:hypothetical protein AVEN_174390-1 [Araneus ventricosus]|uniref:CCHC-type domain-containing protein n=1 Tax=Araneus ventricosus TaxID=182803 RepID=A0A4Y2T2E8_ARAVE|nr:hypothetical protein AVEN_174390-1 [Araneus ventricosus]
MSTEGQELENSIKGLLQKEINPQKEGFEVTATRPLRNKGLAVDCTSKDHLDILLEKLNAKTQLTEKIEIKKPEKRFPRCVIYDLEEDTQEGDVLKALANATQAEEKDFRICFKMKGKGGRSHFVVTANPALTLALLEKKKINIHWSKHNIREHLDIKRCYKCQDFGHLQANCKRQYPYCAFCGFSHNTRNCRNDRPRCVNCLEANGKRKDKVDICHMASDNKCPSFLREHHFPSTKILQINLQKTISATDNLKTAIVEHKIDIIIAQEPYVYNGTIAGTPQSWAKWSSKNKKAVILAPQNISPVILTPKENAIAIKVNLNNKPCTIVSAYSSPLEEVEHTLQDIQEYINEIQGEDYIIGADLNGQHHNWGYSYTSPRGRAIDHLIGSCRAMLLNTEDAPPSFFHPNGTVGRPDLSVSSASLASNIEWKILQDETMSDHKYILMNISLKRQTTTFQRFKTKYGGHRKFRHNLNNHSQEMITKLIECTTKEDLDIAFTEVHQELIDICKKSYKIKKQELLKPPSWWTPTLEMEKKKLCALRRRGQRQARSNGTTESSIYNREKAKLRKKIKRTKTSAWQKFCTEETNPYGRHYKAAFRKGSPPSDLFQQHSGKGTELEFATSILDCLYPTTVDTPSEETTNTTPNIDLPFTKSEVNRIIHRLPKGKAPGYDGIDNIILQQIFFNTPDLILTIVNKCLEHNLFPSSLKIGIVLLFYKEGKDTSNPKSYRPITLLPTIGKMLEKLMTQRMEYHLEKTNQHHSKQYGFREGRSIDHALDNLLEKMEFHKS